MLDTNTMLLVFMVALAIVYISYCSIVLWKHASRLSDAQERRLSTLILLMIFFVLSMIYDYAQSSHLFLAVWFLYALFNAVKEMNRVVNIKCNKRSTDKDRSKCLLC